MKVLYVNSGPNPVHEPLDRYIDLTFQEMDVTYKLFDFAAHISYFDAAFDCLQAGQDINYSMGALYRYAAAPLLQVVSDFEPDLVFTVFGGCLPKSTAKAIRKMGATTAFWAVDDPFRIDGTLEQADAYDYIFTADSAAVDVYRSFGYTNAHHLPLAAFPRVHRKVAAGQYASDVCFTGLREDDLSVGFKEVAAELEARGLKVTILEQTCEPAEAARYHAAARLNVNIHRAADAVSNFDGIGRDIEAVSPNAKTFEIASCGGFQLVDSSRAKLYKYFDVGRDLDIFSSPEELISKVEYYLKDDELREKMARGARERALAEHTVRARMELVLEKTLRHDSRGVIYQVINSTNTERANINRKSAELFKRAGRFVVEAVPSGAKRVLDVGCGEGLLAEALKAHGVGEIYGVETDEALAARARERLDKVIVADIEAVELPFKANYFDCLIYANVLEHLKDPRKTLTRQRRYLTSGGQVVALVANTLYFPVLKELLKGQGRYSPAALNGSLQFFTLREVAHMFRWAGYDIEDVKGIPGDLVNPAEMADFIKRFKSLDVAPESFAVEAGYAQYLVVARRARSEAKQGANLCLVKS